MRRHKPLNHEGRRTCRRRYDPGCATVILRRPVLKNIGDAEEPSFDAVLHLFFPALELTTCSAARRSVNRCNLDRGACLLEAKETPPADDSAEHAGLGFEESTDVHAR